MPSAALNEMTIEDIAARIATTRGDVRAGRARMPRPDRRARTRRAGLRVCRRRPGVGASAGAGRGKPARTAAWRAGRDQGHHRYRRSSDRDGLVGLPRSSAADRMRPWSRCFAPRAPSSSARPIPRNSPAPGPRRPPTPGIARAHPADRRAAPPPRSRRAWCLPPSAPRPADRWYGRPPSAVSSASSQLSVVSIAPA